MILLYKCPTIFSQRMYDSTSFAELVACMAMEQGLDTRVASGSRLATKPLTFVTRTFYITLKRKLIKRESSGVDGYDFRTASCTEED